jgi:hypothetical protein
LIAELKVQSAFHQRLPFQELKSSRQFKVKFDPPGPAPGV